MDKESKEIIGGYWENYVKYKNIESSPIIKPSIPILWFGNLNEYKNSQEKIITFAINLSSNEFRVKKEEEVNFIRFKGRKEIYSENILSNNEMKIFIKILNNYFMDEPYFRGFKKFKFPLNCMNASYEGKLKNRNL